MLLLYGHLGCKYVAPSRHGLQYALINVADCSANVADALRDRVVGDDNIAPDRTIYGVPVQELSRVRDEDAQEIERLGPEGDFYTVRVKQCATYEIEKDSSNR